VFQEILTDRLILRCLHLADADAMFAYRGDPNVYLYQSWEPQSLQEVQLFIASTQNVEFNTPGWYQIAIALRENSTLIGDLGIHILEADPRIAEIGITITPSMQGNGYATEAIKAILKLLFVELQKHRVFASVDPQNLPSMALMERIGFRNEGHFIQSLWFKNNWVDDVVFAMLAREWNQSHEGETPSTLA
jgi:RimJ/RimL family protein N-acetyltransferase